jgi:hypothetical protein
VPLESGRHRRGRPDQNPVSSGPGGGYFVEDGGGGIDGTTPGAPPVRRDQHERVPPTERARDHGWLVPGDSHDQRRPSPSMIRTAVVVRGTRNTRRQYRRVASTITSATATPIPTTSCARPSRLRRSTPGLTALSPQNERLHSRGRTRRTCKALAVTDLGRAIAVDSDRCEQHAGRHGAASLFVADARPNWREQRARESLTGTRWQERHRRVLKTLTPR